MAPVLKAMFTSEGFFAPQVVGTQIKNPVEYVVGVVRSLQGDLDVNHYANAAAAMGMELYNPPDVSGWKGGEDWNQQFHAPRTNPTGARTCWQGSQWNGVRARYEKIISDNFFSKNDELVDHFLVRFMHRVPDGKLRPTLMAFLQADTRRRAWCACPVLKEKRNCADWSD